MRLKASLVMVSLPSNNIEQSKAFLQGLLGIDFVRNLDEQTESYHTPISEDGIDLHVSPPRHPQEAPMVYFHVDDLDATIRQAVNTGGSLLFGPQAITISDRAFVAYEEAYRQAERGGPRVPPRYAEWPSFRTRAAVPSACSKWSRICTDISRLVHITRSSPTGKWNIVIGAWGSPAEYSAVGHDVNDAVGDASRRVVLPYDSLTPGERIQPQGFTGWSW